MYYEKKYKEALDKLQEALAPKEGCDISGLTRRCIEDIFPELKEIEDERMRKAIIAYIKKANGEPNHILPSSPYSVLAMIFWLEKQGEQKATNDTDEEIVNAVKDTSILDMVEPKFKVGDWIANDYCTGKVIAITDDAYLLDSGQGIPFSCEHNAHLWTIEDAKDGDVLVDVYGNIGIFQKNDDFDWSSYCSLGSNGGFRCFAIEHELDRSHPATKEQRDLLFQKIKEAGYEWDAEKKELTI